MWPIFSASKEHQTLLPLYKELPAHTSTSEGNRPLLPRYEKLPPYAPYSDRFTMQLPEDTATPRGVRKFLRFLLATKREISDSHALLIAGLWTVGDGYELRAYSKPMFQQLFGVEYGRVIWDDLNLCTENDQMHRQRYARSVEQEIRGTMCTATVCMVLVAYVFLWLCFTSRVGARTAGALQLCLAVAFVVLCAIWYPKQRREWEESVYKEHMKRLSKAKAEKYFGKYSC